MNPLKGNDQEGKLLRMRLISLSLFHQTLHSLFCSLPGLSGGLEYQILVKKKKLESLPIFLPPLEIIELVPKSSAPTCFLRWWHSFLLSPLSLAGLVILVLDTVS